MHLAASKRRFGEVLEISGVDYVQEVNNAGEGVWVVLHLYKQGWVSDEGCVDLALWHCATNVDCREFHTPRFAVFRFVP